MSVVIRLSFLTDQSKVATLRVSRANKNATLSQISKAMEDIIDSKAFDTKGRGNIIEKDSAQLIITSVENYNV